MRNKGFTMIELVMVIVILAILAAVAIPRFINLRVQAQNSAEAGVVGGVRAGISAEYIRTASVGVATWPDPLDDAIAGNPATVAVPFFDVVLAQGGITEGWTKGADIYTYVNDNTTTSWTYTPTGVDAGSFVVTP